MCGVVGYTGKGQAIDFLLYGLQTLEYRGYDSAGVAVLSPDDNLHLVKVAGRVAALKERCDAANLVGSTGIGHTRWATHGAPTDRNAHPHTSCDGRIAVVHNGIIENYEALRRQLMAEGHNFKSDTDTEVVAHLVEDAWRGPARGDLASAVRYACDRLLGARHRLRRLPGRGRRDEKGVAPRRGVHQGRRLCGVGRHAACEGDVALPAA